MRGFFAALRMTSRRGCGDSSLRSEGQVSSKLRSEGQVAGDAGILLLRQAQAQKDKSLPLRQAQGQNDKLQDSCAQNDDSISIYSSILPSGGKLLCQLFWVIFWVEVVWFVAVDGFRGRSGG